MDTRTATWKAQLRAFGIPMMLIGGGIALACAALPAANAAIVVGGVLLVIVLDMTGVFDNRPAFRAAALLGIAPRRRTAEIIDLASARRARMRARHAHLASAGARMRTLHMRSRPTHPVWPERDRHGRQNLHP